MEKTLDLTRVNEQVIALKQHLGRRVVGQPQACLAIANSYERHIAGLSPAGRPISSMLFLGPTGVGKTSIVEALAEHLYGEPTALTRVDCGEYQHGHEIAKLTGSPPGYLGHRETHGVLSPSNIHRHWTPQTKITLLIFDEIEKASDTVWRLLLGMMEKGECSLGDNTVVNFERTMLFLTSNLGVEGATHSRSGFRAGDTPRVEWNPGELLLAVNRKFSAEFRNRLTHTVVFNPLSREQVRDVLALELSKIADLMMTKHQILVTFTEDLQQWLFGLAYNEEYGARYVRKQVEQHVNGAIAKLLSTRQLTPLAMLELGYANGYITAQSKEIGHVTVNTNTAS